MKLIEKQQKNNKNKYQYPLVGGRDSFMVSDNLGDWHKAQGKKEDQDYQGHLEEIKGIRTTYTACFFYNAWRTVTRSYHL